MNKDIFRAYDIRGIYPKEIDEKTAYCIGQNFVKLIKEENPEKQELNIVVGQDMRLSSPDLAKQVIAGVIDAGANVIDIGLASTPTFYYAVARYGYDGGLEVSASHNPKEYNGVKIVRAKAYPVGLPNGLDKIRDACVVHEDITADKKGQVSEKTGILEERVQEALKFYDFSKIKPFKVVVDTANSMGSPDLEELFKHLPCQLIKMNFDLDGTFPVHEADPFKPENIADLKKKVIAENADLGVATDGDADRIFFIDNKGDLIEPEIIRGLMAKEVLKHYPGAPIGYDIRPGMITREMIEEFGGQPFVTKVGHSLIKKDSIDRDAPFSGESSGHLFFKTKHGFFETPLIVALVLMKQMSEAGKSIAEIVEPLRKYFHSGEINSEVENKKAKMQELEEKFGSDAKNVSWLDGVTIEHDDWWFNVRPSNTESKLRLNLEAKNKDIMQEKRDEVLGVIRS
ncbi:phosphomannomutase/phosphoglucomutase [Patescibacteria group bacterium]